MKTFMALAMFLLMSLVGAMQTVTNAEVIIPPSGGPTYELKRVPLNNYFIGMNWPDGSCHTMQILASSYEEAVEVVKMARCNFCAIRDMTAYYTSTQADVVSSANRTCPLR